MDRIENIYDLINILRDTLDKKYFSKGNLYNQDDLYRGHRYLSNKRVLDELNTLIKNTKLHLPNNDLADYLNNLIVNKQFDNIYEYFRLIDNALENCARIDHYYEYEDE